MYHIDLGWFFSTYYKNGKVVTEVAYQHGRRQHITQYSEGGNIECTADYDNEVWNKTINKKVYDKAGNLIFRERRDDYSLYCED